VIFSVELILGIIAITFVFLSTKEYLSNGKVVTPKIKTWLRIAVIFFLVTIINLLIRTNQ